MRPTLRIRICTCRARGRSLKVMLHQDSWKKEKEMFNNLTWFHLTMTTIVEMIHLSKCLLHKSIIIQLWKKILPGEAVCRQDKVPTKLLLITNHQIPQKRRCSPKGKSTNSILLLQIVVNRSKNLGKTCTIDLQKIRSRILRRKPTILAPESSLKLI